MVVGKVGRLADIAHHETGSLHGDDLPLGETAGRIGIRAFRTDPASPHAEGQAIRGNPAGLIHESLEALLVHLLGLHHRLEVELILELHDRFEHNHIAICGDALAELVDRSRSGRARPALAVGVTRVGSAHGSHLFANLQMVGRHRRDELEAMRSSEVDDLLQWLRHVAPLIEIHAVHVVPVKRGRGRELEVPAGIHHLLEGVTRLL